MHRRCVAALLVPLLGAAPPAVSHPITLADALDMARRTSVLLSAQQSVAAAQRVAAQAQAYPRTALAISGSEEPDAGDVFPKYAQSAALGLDFGASRSRAGAIAATRASVGQSAANLAATRRDTARVVIDAFFAVAGDLAQMQAQTDASALANRTYLAAADRHNVGLAPLVDVQRAQSAFALAQADLAAARESLAGDQQTLSMLVGSADPPAILVPAVPSALPDAASVSQAALRADPAVAGAQAAYDAARAASLVARGAVQPGFAISGGVGRSSSGALHATAPVANLTVNVPLETASDHAAIASADAAAAVAEASLEESRREAVATALRARTAVSAQLVRLSYLQQAFTQAQRVADADLGGYRLGAVSSADLIFAQTQLAAARASLRSAQVQAAHLFAQLQLEIGELPA